MTGESRGEKNKTKQSDGLQVYTSEKPTMDVYMVFMQRDRDRSFLEDGPQSLLKEEVGQLI